MRNAFLDTSRTLLVLLFGLFLAACGEPVEQKQNLGPVAFHSSDECHVCGMIITDFPGPKGEAVDGALVKKFALLPKCLVGGCNRRTVLVQPGCMYTIWGEANGSSRTTAT